MCLSQENLQVLFPVHLTLCITYLGCPPLLQIGIVKIDRRSQNLVHVRALHHLYAGMHMQPFSSFPAIFHYAYTKHILSKNENFFA